MAGAAGSVPCLEVFDENSQPSVEEISEYAQQIGIDPSSESYLLPLAKDGLMQALPTPWKAYYDDKLKAHYFYNTDTKVTQWDHPLDTVYKNLVVKARQASEHGDSILDDTCVSIQDLITYEEDARQITEDKIDYKNKLKCEDGDSIMDSSLDEEISLSRSNNIEKLNSKKSQKPPLTSFAKKPLPTLNPLNVSNERKLGNVFHGLARTGESNTFPRTAQLGVNRFKNIYQQSDVYDNDEDLYNIQGDSKNEPVKFNASNKRTFKLVKQASEMIDLSFNPVKNDSVDSDNESNRLSKKGVILTGGGSVFLKSNRSVQSNSDDKNSVTQAQNLKSNNAKDNFKSNMLSMNDNIKGILRDRNFGDLVIKSPFVDKNFDFDEDKKSVRFNLEHHDVNIPYDYSPSPSSNSSSDMLVGEQQNSVISQDKNFKIEPPKLGKFIVRRNSENSIGVNEIQNLRKLKPLNYNDNQKVMQLPKEAQQSGKTEDVPSVTSSPTRKLIKPNPGDFIKPNLFQKPFEKLSDILNTASGESDSESDQQENHISPPPPMKRKLSINLMESVDSEASIDSPDKESYQMNLPSAGAISKIDEKILLKTKRNDSFDLIKKSSKKVTTVIEDDNDSQNSELKLKRNTEINELKMKMENDLKELKSNMEEEFKREIQIMKDKLNQEHTKNKADVNEAISKAQREHDEKIQDALKSLNIEFSISKEKAIVEEKDKLAKNLIETLKNLNEEHNLQIEKVKHDKKNQLTVIGTNLDQENLKLIHELRMQYADNLEAEKLRLIADNKSALDKMKSEHEIMCDELRNDYRSEVELVRGQQAAHLSALREKLRREREPSRPPATLSPPSNGVSPRDDTSYERLRCDKRLLEDKYRCLKEKYARLKSDVKVSIERRNKRREQSVTTGSETERSHSHKTGPSTDKSADVGESGIKKNMLIVNNGSVFSQLKNVNNNEMSSQMMKEAYNKNNNQNGELLKAINDNDSISQHNNPYLLNVTNRNIPIGNVSDQLRGKSPNFNRDKSPTGRVYPKPFSGDNDNSIGMNDASLSHSDSHTASNGKFNKRVNIIDHKDRHKEGVEFRLKSGLRKMNKPDRNYADTTVTDYHDSSDTGVSEQRNINESVTGKHRRKIFTRLKSASTSRLNYSISSKLNERACSPVENLRQQLRKLEDLEEQFPDVTLNADTTAYRLRYPFPDSGGGVSGGELGFLRHRALVEREGVRRARAVLRRRSDLLRQKRRSPAAWQEECELTDMEVSLHRTKSILGEKVIRLRHIEKSLRRIQGGNESDAKTDSNVPKQRDSENKDTTLSDISSHSSGFSSTEAHSDTNRNGKRVTHSAADYEHSSEIINSLQTLNTEIRDIWQVLNAQQQMNVAKVIPIGQLLYTDVGWQLPIAASNIPNIQSLPNSVSINVPALNVPVDNVNSIKDKIQNYRQMGNVNPKFSQGAPASGGVATSLVERTRDLRDWLKQQAAL